MFAIWIGIMCLVVILQQVLVEEVYTEQEEDERTVIEKLKEIKDFLGVFLKKPVHALLAVDYTLEASIAYNNGLWVTYFFEKLGFGSISPIITMLFLLMQVPGLFGMEFLITKEFIKARYITTVLLLLNAILYVWMIAVDLVPENSTFFLISFGLSGLFLGGPFSRTAAS